MKVLVAGASGAVGVPLTSALVASGHEVIALSRTPGNEDRLRSLGAEPLVADVLERAALLRAVEGFEVDAVFNMLTALKKAPARHRDMEATNVLRERGTANLLAAARVVGAGRLVTQSMIFGYGYGDWGGKVLGEDDPPFGPSGRSRRLERHIEALRSAESQTFAADGIEGIALRYGLIYGPGAVSEEMVGMLKRRRLPVLRGGGTLSWIHIEDAVNATVAALEKGKAGGAYNVVDDEPTGWAELVRALARASGAPPPPAVPRLLLRPLAPYACTVMASTLRVSNDKAKRELGWRPSYPTYRQGIAGFAASLRSGTPKVGARRESGARLR